jgi:hypothetical protein
MATAMKAHLSSKVSGSKHSGINGSTSSLGIEKVNTIELWKKASTAKG